MTKDEIIRELEYILWVLEDMESECAATLDSVIDALGDKDFE